MDRDEYLKLAREAARLDEARDYARAIEILRSLVSSDIPNVDKAMMCLNIALLTKKLGNHAEVLNWYDQGIAYERGQGQFFVAESKAVYLADQGNTVESLMLYESLLKQPSLSENDRQRFSANIQTLRARLND